MPEYQYIQVGLRPETLAELDRRGVEYSPYIRDLVEDALDE